MGAAGLYDYNDNAGGVVLSCGTSLACHHIVMVESFVRLTGRAEARSSVPPNITHFLSDFHVSKQLS